MKRDMGNMVFESRTEVELLWNALEIAIADNHLTDDEAETAKEACRLLEAMDYEW